jgi:hypothetical protein
MFTFYVFTSKTESEHSHHFHPNPMQSLIPTHDTRHGSRAQFMTPDTYYAAFLMI